MKPTRRNLFAAALLLLPSAVPPAHKAKPAPPPAPVSSGKLEIRLLLTLEPDKVFHPKKEADGKFSEAQPVRVAPRGQLVGGVVFFKDCKADAAGNCNVDVDLQGFLPNGSLFENRKASDLWRNKKAPHAGFVQLGGAYVKIQIESKDPAGTYRVLAVAHDRVAGTEARSEGSFEVK
ncbi:MAG TPA: hypothetical protein VF173_36920 [Thermoanaerobaculia bacterium]|nr:hypothetical protein [Thermoanaerobaculia bacterium]